LTRDLDVQEKAAKMTDVKDHPFDWIPALSLALGVIVVSVSLLALAGSVFFVFRLLLTR